MGYIAHRETRAALELFNRLYADGKDIAAILDELACLTRDLLVMKTASGVGITMLSGVATEKEVQDLLGAFSSGELVRMMELIQSTAAGFVRNSSRRLDAELCIVNLCQPELSLDARSLNARLTRLEEQLRTGKFVPAASASGQIPEQDGEERPPFPGDEDAPSRSEADPDNTPIPESNPGQSGKKPQVPPGFWADLVGAVRPEVRPPASGFFVASPNSPLRGVMKGETLILVCDNTFVAEILNKPDILEVVSRKASVLLGKNVPVKVADRSAAPQKSAQMEQLLNFGRAHHDIVKIKEN